KKITGLRDADDVTKEQLHDEARAALLEAVRPGCERLLARWMAAEPLATDDDGVWKFPQGVAYYNHCLADWTTTTLTAEEIHEIGLREVARIQDEMRALQPRLGVKGDLARVFEFLRTDERFNLPPTPEGRQEYLDRATAIV